MDTQISTNCPSCGTLLDQEPGSLADGLCPRCLLERSLQTTIAGHPDSSQSGPSVAPACEEVAASFPELEIVELIGRGGMGAVYKARQKSLDRLVALKLLPLSLASDPEFAKRFEAEAKALAALNHPNIVTVHEFGQKGDFYFLLMEYVDGPNLRNLLVEHRIAPEEALTIIPPLCEALEYAHKRNIVHCDIKPENLLLNTDGQVKIADFGIARILGQSPSESESENAVGTPAYMAPEQIESPSSIDTRADIYSLGVVFYEMLTGERPNHDLTPPSGKNPSLDGRLDEVVLRALDANPNFRWQSANELNTELQTILSKQSSEPKIAPPKNLPKSSPNWAWVSLVIASATMVTYALLSFFHHSVTPVSETEHQALIDDYFEYKMHLVVLGNEFEDLEAKPERTPAEDERKEELWDQISEGFTAIEKKRALAGVSDPLIERDLITTFLILCGPLCILTFFLGFRHLSWLRGQKEPLPAFSMALLGVLLIPFLLSTGFVLQAVFRYEALIPNALALGGTLLLGFWIVRRVVAWTRNLRDAPALRMVQIFVIALIGLVVAFPITAVQKKYSNEYRKMARATIDLERSHQEYFATLQFKKHLSDEEKLEEARLGCENYARTEQAFELFSGKPQQFDVMVLMAWPTLALIAAVLLSIKTVRIRRA